MEGRGPVPASGTRRNQGAATNSRWRPHRRCRSSCQSCTHPARSRPCASCATHCAAGRRADAAVGRAGGTGGGCEQESALAGRALPVLTRAPHRAAGTGQGCAAGRQGGRLARGFPQRGWSTGYPSRRVIVRGCQAPSSRGREGRLGTAEAVLRAGLSAALGLRSWRDCRARSREWQQSGEWP